jgi:hypothetical protein
MLTLLHSPSILRHWTFCFLNFENCNERAEGSLEALSGTGLLGLKGITLPSSSAPIRFSFFCFCLVLRLFVRLSLSLVHYPFLFIYFLSVYLIFSFYHFIMHFSGLLCLFPALCVCLCFFFLIFRLCFHILSLSVQLSICLITFLSVC